MNDRQDRQDRDGHIVTTARESRPRWPTWWRATSALLGRQGQEERQRSVQERLADTITGFAGSMAFVYRADARRPRLPAVAPALRAGDGA
jgi:hypothetical protein